MSRLEDRSITIYEALQNIKNGKYVMPAFQRQFVWSMEQVEKLWDSILLDYPVATFLFWHIDETNVTNDTNFCNFLTDVSFNSRKQSDSVNYDLSGIDTKITDTAILDGQQRLTSLYLSLFGNAYVREKHARKSGNGGIISKLVIELNKNKLDVDEEEYNSKQYDIKFTDKIGRLSPTQFEVKKIIDEKFKSKDTRKNVIKEIVSNFPTNSLEYAENTLTKLCEKIYDEKLIRYAEISDMKTDDALEMFVRFNAGGKPLKKSDITMSILEAYWPTSKTVFGNVLNDSLPCFGTDFIIRAALMLYGDVVKSNINKQVADDLKNNWNNFRVALENLKETLDEFKISISHFSSSWNVLLPILYVIYWNPDYRKCIRGIHSYLLRAILFTYFQSGTTGKLQKMKSYINEYEYEITTEMLDQITDLHISEAKIEDVVNSEKGSRVATETLYFLSLDWRKEYVKYDQDHLHPYIRFDSSNPPGISLETWRHWRNNRNKLPNIHFLEGRSNESKSSMRLIDYYNDMNTEQQIAFRKEALIPENVSLELENFSEFYEARKNLLAEKIRELLE